MKGSTIIDTVGMSPVGPSYILGCSNHYLFSNTLYIGSELLKEVSLMLEYTFSSAFGWSYGPLSSYLSPLGDNQLSCSSSLVG